MKAAEIYEKLATVSERMERSVRGEGVAWIVCAAALVIVDELTRPDAPPRCPEMDAAVPVLEDLIRSFFAAEPDVEPPRKADAWPELNRPALEDEGKHVDVR